MISASFTLAGILLGRFASEGPSLHTPTRSQQTKQELIKIFAKANDLLRREGLRQGVERFSEFSNLLFLKIISEIEDDRERTGESRRLEKLYCWTAFATKPQDEMLNYINDTVLPRLVKDYNHSSEVFEPRLRITSAATLKELVDELSELSLLDTDSDIKGDAFEYFLKHSISVGNDLGEYFTPRLIVDLIDPRYGETVYDPCCGTGGFLIQAFRHVAGKVTDTPEHRHVLENETIYGCELTGTARIAKMNMILAGDGHTNILQQDSLAHPLRGIYDVVLTNFPFSQETEHGNKYGAPIKDANPVFLRHVVEAAKDDGGRIGVVVPEGLLFGEQKEYELARKFVVDNCAVEAVIALHSFVFRPYTGQPTAILILKKGGTELWATITDISNMETRYLTRTAEKITQKAVQETSVKLLPPGTVLLSYKLSIGKTAIAGQDIYTNEAITGLVPKNSNEVLPEYVYYLLPFLNIEDHAQPAAKGNTLNKSILERLRIPVPGVSEQERFIETMKKREAQARNLRERAADEERELRDEAHRFIADQ